jgi:hypothetical protein
MRHLRQCTLVGKYQIRGQLALKQVDTYVDVFNTNIIEGRKKLKVSKNDIEYQECHIKCLSFSFLPRVCE